MNLKKIRYIHKVLKTKPWWIDKDELCRSRTVVSAILGAASAAMLVMNIINHVQLMAALSVVLVLGFAMSAVASGVFRKPDVSAWIIAVLVCAVLSAFALSGGNEGFAILWILLVPVFAVSLMDLTRGVIIATYFLLFIYILFLSPLNASIADKYTVSFISRFPVLYTCDYLISMYFSIQKEYFYRRIHLNSMTDELTGAYNRRYFLNTIRNRNVRENGFTGVMVMDLNGLKIVNDTYGHEAGDELICALPECCRRVWGNDCVICRMGGDEFALVLKEDEETIRNKVEMLRRETAAWKGSYSSGLAFSVGWASLENYPDLSFEELHKTADKLMYEDKHSFYRLRENDRRKR